VTQSYDKNSAVVVLPPVSGGRLQDPGLRAWLARADLSRRDSERELLSLIVAELGLPYPEEGLAALRMWGQTGDQPTVWIAAADPVYLEPRLDRLCLHALRRQGVPSADLRPLIDHIQDTLANGRSYDFARLGSCGYLRTDAPMASAAVPSYVLDGQAPDEYLPKGEGADEYRKLISEVEMAIHEHEVNRSRAGRDLPPINSLWIWGGGKAPERTKRLQPPLYSDDPLLTGYWESATARAETWPGSIADCAAATSAGFVAEVPEGADDPELLETCLRQLRSVVTSGRLSGLVLLFRDGLRAEIKRSQVLRFWRRDSELLE